MGVQVVYYEYPLTCWVKSDRLCYVAGKICLRAGELNCRGDDLPGRHFKVGKKTLGSMANIAVLSSFVRLSPTTEALKFHFFYLTRPHGLCWVFPFQSLDTCFFIRTYQVNPLLLKYLSLEIQFTDWLGFFGKIFA